MKAIDGAIARIMRRDGTTLGTGFFVAGTGELLTCDHVVALAGSEDISVLASNGASEVVGASRIVRFPDSDVALIRSGMAPPVVAPLASTAPENQFRFWTKGFQYGSIGVKGGFPLSGTTSGTTSVRYDTYSHDEVVVLTEAAVDHGMSGGPLVDADSGVVVGIVIAKIPDSVRQVGGFAVSTGSMATNEVLRELIRRNREQVACFGEFGNLLGLRELTQAQSNQAIQTLENSRLFLPRQEVRREDLYAEAAAFRGSVSQVFPIIGYSGSGKTFSLAALTTKWTTDYPVLFLRGFDLTDADLSGAIGGALENAAAEATVPLIPSVSWIAALNEGKARLIVVLDGLNEAPQGVRREIDHWLMRSFSWLRGKPIQLVVSCKPDFWDSIESIFRSAAIKVYFAEREAEALRAEPAADRKTEPPKPEPFRMSDFSSVEIDAALEAYSLAGAGIAPNEVRHPSLLRIYSEVAAHQAGSAAHSVDRYQVFEQFVDDKIARVARSTGSIKGVVFDLLSRAAKVCFELRTYELTSEVFFGDGVFGPAREIAQELIREHVFLETADGFRFSFEEVAEFLQARFVDIERVSQYASSSVAVSALSFAMLRLERENRVDELRRAAAALLASAPAGTYVSWTVVRALTWLENPEAIFDLIEEFCRTLDEYQLESLIHEIKLPWAETFRLMRIMAQMEDYYPWEPHHWPMPENLGLRPVFEEMLERDPHAAFAEISKWVSDKTSLRGGGSVSEVALGLMFQFRARDLAYLAETLAPLARADGFEFFYRIAKYSDLSELQPILMSWVDREDRQNAAAFIIHQFVSQNSDENRAAIEMLRRLSASARDDEVRAFALEILLRFPEYRDEDGFQKMVALMREGNPSVDSAYTLTRFMDQHLNEVIALLEERYLSNDDSRRGTLQALSHFDGDAELKLRVVDFARRIWKSHPDSANAVAYFLEARSYKEAPNTDVSKSLRQLGIDLAGATTDEHTRRVLVFAATAKGPSGYTPEQIPLIDAVMATEQKRETLRFLVKRLAPLISKVPEISERADRILPIIGPDWAAGLLVEPGSSEATDRMVARWLEQGKLRPKNEYLKAMAEGLKAGLGASEAAEKAREIFRS